MMPIPDIIECLQIAVHNPIALPSVRDFLYHMMDDPSYVQGIVCTLHCVTASVGTSITLVHMHSCAITHYKTTIRLQ